MSNTKDQSMDWKDRPTLLVHYFLGWVTVSVATITVIVLMTACYYLESRPELLSSLPLHWAVQPDDHTAFALNSSKESGQIQDVRKIVILGNSHSYSALGDPRRMAELLSVREVSSELIFDLSAPGQSIAEAAALLEKSRVDAQTIVVWGINEMSLAPENDYFFSVRGGTPESKEILPCSEIRCKTLNLNFYMARLGAVNSQANIPSREYRFQCEIAGIPCRPEADRTRVPRVAGYKDVHPTLEQHLRRVFSFLKDKAGSQVIFFWPSLNPEFKEAVGNPTYFEAASSVIKDLALELEIPIVSGVAQAPDGSNAFQDYGHIADQPTRDQNLRSLAAGIDLIQSRMKE